MMAMIIIIISTMIIKIIMKSIWITMILSLSSYIITNQFHLYIIIR